jgi:hypothetical protein
MFNCVGNYLFERSFSIRASSTIPTDSPSLSVVGFAIIIVALIAASFSTSLTHLILTQGILYAIGGSLLYSPTVFYLDEWFIQRKDLAFGVMWAGTGMSGLILPFVLSWLLSAYGFRTTLRAWAILFMALAGPFVYFVKPRLPVLPTGTAPRLACLLCTNMFLGYYR